MPIYEYHCCSCGKDFETFVWSSRDEEKVTCPACGKDDVKRLLSSFSCQGSLANAAGAGSASGCGGGLGGFS